jgi:hypothetical protein
MRWSLVRLFDVAPLRPARRPGAPAPHTTEYRVVQLQLRFRAVQPYPFQPLERAARRDGLTGETALCNQLGVSWFRLQLFREIGLDWDQADRFCDRLPTARHPTELWTNWGDDT